MVAVAVVAQAVDRVLADLGRPGDALRLPSGADERVTLRGAGGEVVRAAVGVVQAVDVAALVADRLHLASLLFLWCLDVHGLGRGILALGAAVAERGLPRLRAEAAPRGLVARLVALVTVDVVVLAVAEPGLHARTIHVDAQLGVPGHEEHVAVLGVPDVDLLEPMRQKDGALVARPGVRVPVVPRQDAHGRIAHAHGLGAVVVAAVDRDALAVAEVHVLRGAVAGAVRLAVPVRVVADEVPHDLRRGLGPTQRHGRSPREVRRRS